MLLGKITKGPITDHLKHQGVSIITDLKHVLIVGAKAALDVAQALSKGMRLPPEVRNKREHSGIYKEKG
jgi:hypothetical protein